MITPTAATGAIFQDLNPRHPSAPDLRASHAAAVAVAPNGRMLAILTSGYSRHFSPDGKLIPELSTEYLFLYDVSGAQPKQAQALPIPNTFVGLAWAPSSESLFASGGADDTVAEFVRQGPAFAAGRTIKLGHMKGVGPEAQPTAGSIAVSPDGTRLLVANLLGMKRRTGMTIRTRNLPAPRSSDSFRLAGTRPAWPLQTTVRIGTSSTRKAKRDRRRAGARRSIPPKKLASPKIHRARS
jgi:hypothetical protein